MMALRYSRGFGLVEVMIALVLGLVVVLGISQIFVSAKNSYQTQDAAAKLQEDARYALSRISQEVRMAGMFGCVGLDELSSYPSEFDTPISWVDSSKILTLITSSPVSGKDPSTATWTLVTDCETATVDTSAATVTPDATAGEIAIPIRQVEYQYNTNTKSLDVREGGTGSFQPLISGVTAFTVSFGQANSAADDYVADNYLTTGTPDAALIRSVRISMTLADANNRSRSQTYSVVAALRNRLP